MSKEAPKKIFIGSLTTRSGSDLSLTRVLETEAIRGKITEVHAVLGGEQDGYDILSQVADIAFGFKIEPEDIKTNGFAIDASDHFFAIACAKLNEGSETANLAFVLHPCEAKALEECVSSIQNLDVCIGVGSVLRVVE